MRRALTVAVIIALGYPAVDTTTDIIGTTTGGNAGTTGGTAIAAEITGEPAAVAAAARVKTAPAAGLRTTAHGRCNVLVFKRTHRRKMKCGPVPNLWWYQRHYCSSRNGVRHCAKPVLWRHCYSRVSHWECALGEPPKRRHPRHGVSAGAGGTAAGPPATGPAATGAALLALGCGLGLMAMRRRGVRGV